MNNTHYSSSFLITVMIYTLMGLLYLSFEDEFLPIKKKKPEVIKISLITPVIPKKEIKKEKPKPTPKPKKKIIKKKKVIKKKRVKKKRVKKKKVIKKRVIKKPIPKKVIPPKPKPIREERIVKEPVIEEIIPQPITETFVEEPVYYEPPPVYTEIVPQEVYYQQPPQPTAPTVHTAPQSQQRYIINEPLPVNAPPPPTQATIVESAPRVVPQMRTTHTSTHATAETDLSNEKRAFKRETRDIINSNKRYPTMAKRRHIQGTVHVIFDILSSGEIFNIRTSGASTILQKAARKSVMRSSPLTVPTLLQNQFPMNNVSINIDFQLQ
ncbi:MAG: hypothetical protein DSZ11_04935 [Sulfurovum sp.]|nr:MAG: hypothetical protein DSZ11_04935 [Sulfurovum sp.]